MKKADYDLSKLRQLIEVDQLTQTDAAEILGLSRSTIQRACYKHKLKTQGTGPRRGPLHKHSWKGGRKVVKGYVYIYSPDHPYCTKQRYVSEHRLVMERKLGRYLDPKEVVHHIDGDPQNNDPNNLVLFRSNGVHLCEHFQENSDHGKRVQAGMRKAALRRHILGQSLPNDPKVTQTTPESSEP